MARFEDALNEQIAYEFAASQQYIAIAAYYDAESLPQLAAAFYRQAVEERNHAMMMVQFLLDADEPVRLALEQEKRVSEQIAALTKLARSEGDLVGEQFLHWFLQEQREEVSSMSHLLATVERAGDDLLSVEEYLARTADEESPLEAGAPPAAGGAL